MGIEKFNTDIPQTYSTWEQMKNKELLMCKQYINPSTLASNDKYTCLNEGFSSLTGEVMRKEDYVHNNMDPFIKGNITQNTNLENYVVDNERNKIDKLYNNKKETERNSFFRPENNIDVINGSKFESDFFKDRTNESLGSLNNNVFPIDQVRVGPGLNNGYNNTGTGGFHDYNTNIYSLPKKLEDLRSKTNEKEKTFKIDYQAPQHSINKRGIVEVPSKNKPETVYEQNYENWFKTTGAVLKDSERPIENVKATNKQDSHIEYKGGVKLAEGGLGEKDEYSKNTIIVYDNERQTTECKTVMNNPTSIVKSIISPIMDGIKLTKKLYTIDSARELGGNIKGEIDKQTVYDPVNYVNKTTVKETTIHDTQNSNLKGTDESYSALNDIAKTTVKETTIHDTQNTNLKGTDETYSALNDIAKTTVKETTIHDVQISNVKGPVEEGYNTYDDVMKTTVKETTIHDGQISNVKGSVEEGYNTYDDVMKTTVKETVNIQDNLRNIGPTTYQTYVYDPDIVAKTTVKETTITSKNQYGFIGGLLNSLVGGYLNKKVDLNKTNREFTVQEPTRHNVSSIHDHRQANRQSYYEAPQDDTREKILIAAGYTPNPGNMNINLDSSDINMKVDKNVIHTSDYGNIGRIYEDREPNDFFKQSITKENIQNNAYEERLDASIMNSLKTNELNIQINPIK